MSGDEGGQATPAAVLLISVVLLVGAFVANAGAAFETRRSVRAAAAAAARAGAQGQGDALVRGGVVDPTEADRQAQAVLAAAGYTGTVTLVGGRVSVTARGRVRTVMPDPFGLNGRPVTATASADATVGVAGTAVGS